MLVDVWGWVFFFDSCKEERQQYGLGVWEGDSYYCLLFMGWCNRLVHPGSWEDAGDMGTASGRWQIALQGASSALV